MKKKTNRTTKSTGKRTPKGKTACKGVKAEPKGKSSVKRTSKSAPKRLTPKEPVKKQGNIFKGATEVSITQNKIAVTKKVKQSENGKFAQAEVRTYHDKTESNMNALKKLTANAKKITVRF